MTSSLYIKVHPYYEIREIFPCGIRHPGLWISEFSSRNPECLLKIGIRNPCPTDKEIRNPQLGIQNPRLIRFTSHGATPA